MQLEQFVLPTLATVALGTALLVPLRDDRRGKRATLGGIEPLRADFRVAGSLQDHAAVPRPSVVANAESIVVPDDRVTPATEDVPLVLPAAGQIDASSEDAASAETPAATPVARTTSSGGRGRIARMLLSVRHALTSQRQSTLALTAPDADTYVPVVPVADAEPIDAATDVERSFAGELERLLRPTGSPEKSEPRAAVAPTSPSGDAAPNSASPHVVIAQRPLADRIVPLTRLPLRPQSATITWPLLALDSERDAGETSLPLDRTARHFLLDELGRSGRADATDALRLAYREEDAQGRCRALQALARLDSTDASRAVFADALRVGSDDERSIAVDAVAQMDDRDALIAALGDRIDAIAAKAALAFVGSTDRHTFRRELEAHVEPARLEAILAMLAGVVE